MLLRLFSKERERDAVESFIFARHCVEVIPQSNSFLGGSSQCLKFDDSEVDDEIKSLFAVFG
jgi:hypothetical protein